MRKWLPYALLGIGGVMLLGYQKREQVFTAISGVHRRVLSWSSIILTEARRWNVSPSLIAAMMHVESAGNQCALSKKNAYGLMQVLCGTARDMGYKGACAVKCPSGLFDPQTSLFYGVQYLRKQLDRYGGRVDYALAAYNAGTAFRTADGKRFTNQGYVDAVMNRWREYQGIL